MLGARNEGRRHLDLEVLDGKKAAGCGSWAASEHAFAGQVGFPRRVERVAFRWPIAGWPHTLELSAHVHAVPAPEWLRVRVSERNLTEGFLEDDAEVCGSSDRLVAQARQLARVPRQP